MQNEKFLQREIPWGHSGTVMFSSSFLCTPCHLQYSYSLKSHSFLRGEKKRGEKEREEEKGEEGEEDEGEEREDGEGRRGRGQKGRNKGREMWRKERRESNSTHSVY